jgi:hypothetical protein
MKVLLILFGFFIRSLAFCQENNDKYPEFLIGSWIEANVFSDGSVRKEGDMPGGLNTLIINKDSTVILRCRGVEYREGNWIYASEENVLIFNYKIRPFQEDTLIDETEVFSLERVNKSELILIPISAHVLFISPFAFVRRKQE